MCVLFACRDEMEKSNRPENLKSEFVNLDAWNLFEESTDDEEDGMNNGTRSVLEHNNYILGSCIAVGAMFCSCGSVICTQALGGSIPEFQLNMWRFILQTLIVLPIILMKQLAFIPDKSHMPSVLIISLMYNIFNVFYYTSTIHLPLGTVSGATNSFLLIILAVVTVIISRKCTLYTMFSVVLCITGMFLVSQPNFIFDGISGRNISHLYHPVCHKSMNQTENVANEGIGYVQTAVSACAASAMYFLTSKLSHEIDPIVITFWVGISGSVVSPVLMFMFEDIVFPSSTVCQLLLWGHALFTAFATLGYLKSLQYISPLLFALLRSFQIVVLCLSQYTFMKNINAGKDNPAEIAGALIVFVGIIITPMYELYLQSYWKCIVR